MMSLRKPWVSTRRITGDLPEAIVVRGRKIDGGSDRGKSIKMAFGRSFSISWR